MGRSTVAALASSLMFAAALAGCGGSSSTSSQSTASQSTPVADTGTQTTPKSGGRQKHPGGKPKLHATAYNAGTSHTQSVGTGADTRPPASAQNPCTLVSRGEAGMILHAKVLRQVEGQLGPTCLFELKGKQSITIAVEAVDLPRVIARMTKSPAQVRIGGHKAYCGTLGTSLLYVDLGRGRVLKVMAPCAAAEALAAKALPRIKA